MMKSYVVHHIVTACFLGWGALSIAAETDANVLLAALSLTHLSVLLTLEKTLPRDPATNAFRDPQAKNDLGHFAVYSLVRTGLSGLGVFALTRRDADGLLGIWPHAWPFTLQCALALVLWETASYARHRLMHQSDFFWRAHELHHDIQDLHTLKAVRVHVLDDLLAIPFELAIPLTFGGPPEVYLWVFVWNIVFGNLIHANVDQRNPWWLHYLIPTAELHRAHHACESMRSNLAGSLPVIDICFGTFLHPDRTEMSAMGIGDEALPASFLSQLARPFRTRARERA